MTGGLFLLEVIGFYLVAYWAFANEARPGWRGLDQVFGMKADGRSRPVARRQARWKGFQDPDATPIWWQVFVSWRPPNWRSPPGTPDSMDDPDC